MLHHIKRYIHGVCEWVYLTGVREYIALITFIPSPITHHQSCQTFGFPSTPAQGSLSRLCKRNSIMPKWVSILNDTVFLLWYFGVRTCQSTHIIASLCLPVNALARRGAACPSWGMLSPHSHFFPLTLSLFCFTLSLFIFLFSSLGISFHSHFLFLLLDLHSIFELVPSEVGSHWGAP